MKEVFGEQSLTIQNENYLMASRLDDPQENGHIPEDLLDELNAWLASLVLNLSGISKKGPCKWSSLLQAYADGNICS